MPAGSPPPIRAATSIFLISLAKTWRAGRPPQPSGAWWSPTWSVPTWQTSLTPPNLGPTRLAAFRRSRGLLPDSAPAARRRSLFRDAGSALDGPPGGGVLGDQFRNGPGDPGGGAFALSRRVAEGSARSVRRPASGQGAASRGRVAWRRTSRGCRPGLPAPNGSRQARPHPSGSAGGTHPTSGCLGIDDDAPAIRQELAGQSRFGPASALDRKGVEGDGRSGRPPHRAEEIVGSRRDSGPAATGGGQSSRAAPQFQVRGVIGHDESRTVKPS